MRGHSSKRPFAMTFLGKFEKYEIDPEFHQILNWKIASKFHHFKMSSFFDACVSQSK